MAKFDTDMRRSVSTCEMAAQLQAFALEEYGMACERFDWVAAEDARTRFLAHTEALLDHIAATYKRLEVTRGG